MTSCQDRTSSVTAAITYSQGIAEKDPGVPDESLPRTDILID